MHVHQFVVDVLSKMPILIGMTVMGLRIAIHQHNHLASRNLSVELLAAQVLKNCIASCCTTFQQDFQ